MNIFYYMRAESFKEGNKDTVNRVVGVLMVLNRFRSATAGHRSLDCNYTSLKYRCVCVQFAYLTSF